MTPSPTMGTFLRIRRSEWAGLSRAQLALAVSFALTEGKPVMVPPVRPRTRSIGIG